MSSSGSAGIDGDEVCPHPGIVAGHLRLVGFYAETVQRRVPERVRFGVFSGVCDWYWSVCSQVVGIVVRLELLLMFWSRRYKMLRFLVERSSLFSPRTVE